MAFRVLALSLLLLAGPAPAAPLLYAVPLGGPFRPIQALAPDTYEPTGSSVGTPLVGTSYKGLAGSPDGDLFVAIRDGSIQRFDGATGDPLATPLPDIGFEPRDIAFGPTGDLYVSGGGTSDQALHRYDPETGALLASTADVYNIAFDPDGALYGADRFGSAIHRLDPLTFAPLGVAANPTLDWVTDLAFGPDGTLYVANEGDDPVLSIAFQISAHDEDGDVIGSSVTRTNFLSAYDLFLNPFTGEIVVLTDSPGLWIWDLEGTDPFFRDTELGFLVDLGLVPEPRPARLLAAALLLAAGAAALRGRARRRQVGGCERQPPGVRVD